MKKKKVWGLLEGFGFSEGFASPKYFQVCRRVQPLADFEHVIEGHAEAVVRRQPLEPIPVAAFAPQAFGLRVCSFGCRVVVSGFGFRVPGFGDRAPRFGCRFSEFRFGDSGEDRRLRLRFLSDATIESPTWFRVGGSAVRREQLSGEGTT